MPPSVRPAYAAPKNESSRATARQKKSRHRSASAGPTRSNSARRKSNLGNFYGDVGWRGGRGRGIVGRAPPDAPSSTCGRGTEGSNPASSSRESANFRFLRRTALTCLSAAQHYRADAHHGSFPLSGSQIVYCSPMTHGPFSSLRSISSKHSVMVAHTLTLHRLDRRGGRAMSARGTPIRRPSALF